MSTEQLDFVTCAFFSFLFCFLFPPTANFRLILYQVNSVLTLWCADIHIHTHFIGRKMCTCHIILQLTIIQTHTLTYTGSNHHQKCHKHTLRSFTVCCCMLLVILTPSLLPLWHSPALPSIITPSLVPATPPPPPHVRTL